MFNGSSVLDYIDSNKLPLQVFKTSVLNEVVIFSSSGGWSCWQVVNSFKDFHVTCN